MAFACINTSSKEYKDLLEQTGLPEILLQARISIWQKQNDDYESFPKYGDIVFAPNVVKANMKAIGILSSPAAQLMFAKATKNNWPLSKTLDELKIPKEQKELILQLNETTPLDIITSLLANYSFTVEINTAKNKETTLDFNDPRIEFIENTSHYSNLTVPGGTNYTENEIATPGITPSIKGHAQFATDNGIGWFRSDDQTKEGTGRIDEWDDDKNQRTVQNFVGGEATKTRRILEVQSDLFQKGRDKKDLVTTTRMLGVGQAYSNLSSFAIDGIYYYSGMGIAMAEPEDGSANSKKISFKEYEEAKAKWINKNSKQESKENAFLQLLNKNNNWATFFVKAIIQDSAKKGYEKVLFPKGDTASKVEGHTTLEQFKKQKQDRIKELEDKKEKYKNDIESDKKIFNTSRYEDAQKEITQLKQELERVEGPEGFGALRPIYNFYENIVSNIVLKQFGKDNVREITDEYGNTWNEVTLNPERDASEIMYQNVASDITKKEFLTSEKTIRDLAARISDRIGIPYRIISDRTEQYKGKIENNEAIINLAYATLDTPIHEILGHPIIRAIKESNPQLYQNLLKELEYGTGKEVLDRIKRDYEIKDVINEIKVDNPLPNINRYGVDITDHISKLIDTGDSLESIVRSLRRDFLEADHEWLHFNYPEYQPEYYDDEAPPAQTTVEEVLSLVQNTPLRTPIVTYYTLEEQQEEALVEVLGLMTAGKLDNVKDGKLISLLKRLLKEMKAFVRGLLTEREIEVDKLPDIMTIGDIADVLAYSNSKLILPGYEVEYTTPDNQKFKTYQEASNHISQLTKNVADINLSNINLDKQLSKEESARVKELELAIEENKTYFSSEEHQAEQNAKLKEIDRLTKEIDDIKNNVVFYSQEPYLNITEKIKYGFDNYNFVRVESSYSRSDDRAFSSFGEPLWKTHFGKDFEGYYIHGYNVGGDNDTKVLKITKEEAKEIWENRGKEPDVKDRQRIYSLEDTVHSLSRDPILDRIKKLENEILDIHKNDISDFISRNSEYEQSKQVVDIWKEINNIKYNPEEIYSKGQEFVSVLGAYSSFDVDLMMQNLLQHIEDNEKAGGKFAISAFTKPIDKRISHLEGDGKIKIKIYPQSEDILWAANTDVYSGSVWDASQKVSKDKKSELLGVSYTKYPALGNVSKVQPNLASIVDDLAHHHNELGIVLTGNNFRLEYDDNIPYSTKKIIDGVNTILDQKYGKIVKPRLEKGSERTILIDNPLPENIRSGVITYDSTRRRPSYIINNDTISSYDVKKILKIIYPNSNVFVGYTGRVLVDGEDIIPNDGLRYQTPDKIEKKINGIQPTQTKSNLKIDIETVEKTISDVTFNTDSAVFNITDPISFKGNVIKNIISKLKKGDISLKEKGFLYRLGVYNAFGISNLELVDEINDIFKDVVNEKSKNILIINDNKVKTTEELKIYQLYISELTELLNKSKTENLDKKIPEKYYSYFDYTHTGKKSEALKRAKENNIVLNLVGRYRHYAHDGKLTYEIVNNEKEAILEQIKKAKEKIKPIENYDKDYDKVYVIDKDKIKQALINRKIGKLKEVAKKYPRSLIRSEVKEIGSNEYEGLEEYEGVFQKIPSQPIKEGVAEVFEQNPELVLIGTAQEYSDYLDTVFPESKVKDIVYHSSDNEIQSPLDINKSSERGKSNTKGFHFHNIPNTMYGKNIYAFLLNIKNILDSKESKLSYTQTMAVEYFDKGLLSAYLKDAGRNDIDLNSIDGYSIYRGSEIVVEDAKQTHRLGSKEDMKMFQEYMDFKNNVKDYFNLNEEDAKFVKDISNLNDLNC